jgi:hypothetical protein
LQKKIDDKSTKPFPDENFVDLLLYGAEEELVNDNHLKALGYVSTDIKLHVCSCM